MKKNLFILAAAALAFAACSNDEVVESVATSDSNAISFRPFATNLTRAADEHFNTENDQFGVYAFHQGTTSGETNIYINDITFRTSDGTTFTSISNKYYWPSDYNLDFYAYAPLSTEVGGNGSAAVTHSAYNTFVVTPGTDVPNQPDFVYAVTKDWGKATLQTGTSATHQIGSTYTGVTINFRHAESKVLIQLKNMNDNLKITVGDVKIGNLRGTETFTWNQSTNGAEIPTTIADTDDRTTGSDGHVYYLDGTWTGTSSQTSYYTVSMGTDDIDAETADVQARNVFNGSVSSGRDLTSTAANHEMILIPQTLNLQTVYNGTTAADAETHTGGSAFAGAYITVQLKIQNKANGGYIVGGESEYVTAMWPLATVATWLPGHKYTYTIDLAGGGYYDNNQDEDTDLDPILEGAEIKFVSVTVDSWLEETGSVYTGATPSTPVVP